MWQVEKQTAAAVRKSCEKMKLVASQDMQEVLIVCIGRGIIALKVGLDNLLVVTKKFLL
jgi:hypothetical protein